MRRALALAATVLAAVGVSAALTAPRPAGAVHLHALGRFLRLRAVAGRQLHKRSQLEAAWSTAYDENQRRDTPATAKAEQDAWDAYTWECGERNECQHLGCRTITPDWAHCPEHRVA